MCSGDGPLVWSEWTPEGWVWTEDPQFYHDEAIMPSTDHPEFEATQCWSFMKSALLIPLSLCCVATLAQTNDALPDKLGYLQNEGLARIVTSSNLAVAFVRPWANPMAPANQFNSTEPIRFGFSSVSDKPVVFLLLRDSHSLRFSAVSPDGIPVRLTRFGAAFGKEFAGLSGFREEAIDQDQKHPWYVAGPADSLPSFHHSIPAPNRLFRFEKPGVYTVKVEFQCFVSNTFPPARGKPNATNYYLVRFPATEITVAHD